MHRLYSAITVLWAMLICLLPAAAEQVPGYYRFPVGDTMVTALYDGYIRIGAGGYRGITQDALLNLFRAQFETNPHGAPVAVNAYVIETGGKRVMIDAGTADCFGSTMGRLPENMKAAGFPPLTISAILITHMHGDHVCGLSDGARILFPNAEIWAAEEEIAWWLGEGNAAAPSVPWQGYIATARKALRPYRNGRLHAFKDGQTFFGILTAMATHGHTPGHTSFRLSSQGQTFVFAGDIVHGVAVQFARPDVTIISDCDPALAIVSRQHLLQAAADNGWTIAASHVPFPGIGHIRHEGNGFSFVPVEYMPLP